VRRERSQQRGARDTERGFDERASRALHGTPSLLVRVAILGRAALPLDDG